MASMCSREACECDSLKLVICLGVEIRADEWVDLAVHDRLHVSCLGVRAHILHHRIGLEHVGADLAAPLDLLLDALELRDLLLLFFLFELKEFRAKHLHALLLVLEL